MGQLLLGFRSLIIKAVIFMIMAALLAWALGGTLFPRPHVANLRDQAVCIDESCYFWRISIDARRQDHARWELMVERPEEPTQPISAQTWRAGAGPARVPGTSNIAFAGEGQAGQWRLIVFGADGEQFAASRMPDRLAVEQQLLRLARGLPLQSAEQIVAERERRLDPDDDSADNS